VDRFEDWKRPEIVHNVMTKWGWMVAHPENLTLGKKTDIGFGTYIGAQVGVEIRDHVQIGGGVKIYSLSTIDNKQGKITIKLNAKIGANSVVMPDVIIGANSTVGALSFVRSGTRIPENETWAGIPAKRLTHADTVL